MGSQNMGWEEQVSEAEGLEPVTSWGVDMDTDVDRFENATTTFMEFSTPSTTLDNEDDEEGCSFFPGWRHISRVSSNQNIGAGLINLGNTCYLNSLLQCMTYTPPFVEVLRTYSHKIPCTIEGFCCMCSLRDHVELALSSSGKIVEPRVLVENITNMRFPLERWAQEDAHDYLYSLLAELDNCALGTGCFNKIFGGSLKSQRKCTKCLRTKESFEPFIDLNLGIGEADSLTCALEYYTRLETIEYNCDNCQQSVPCSKQLTISQPPDVLIIQLKRGVCDDKIQKMVVYPQVLDLEPFLSENQMNKIELKYELYAVLVHAGVSLYSGHYYCFVRSTYDEWYEMDDSQVTRVNEETVLCQQAYLLFYFRKGIPWFSDFAESRVKNTSKVSTSPKSVLEETAASDDSSRSITEVVLEETTETSASGDSPHDFSKGDFPDNSDGIHSNVDHQILPGNTIANVNSPCFNFSSSAAVSQHSVPANSCISDVEPTFWRDISQDCNAQASMNNPESPSMCNLKDGHGITELDAEPLYKKIHGDCSSLNTNTSEIQDSDRRRLLTAYFKSRSRQRRVMTGKGKFGYDTISHRLRKQAKIVSPGKVKRSSLKTQCMGFRMSDQSSSNQGSNQS